MAKKSKSLAAKLKAVEIQPTGKPTWFTRLSNEAQQEFLEVKQLWQSGELAHFGTVTHLVRYLKSDEQEAISDELARAMRSRSDFTLCKALKDE